ncbi:MAG: hypothetical protein M3P04_04705, partial [Actinomycetota bacterium]|nr:hypothetical protein [Actinomycetota bacterium]
MRLVRLLVPGVVTALLVLGVPFPAEAATPSLRIGDLSVTETQSTVTKTVRVTRSSPTWTKVTVKFRTANGTAVAPADYAARPLTTLTFLPGQVTKLVTVQVAGDAKDEANETFRVLLSSPVNATIADGTGIVTIVDNDAPPVLSLLTTKVVEGSAGLVAKSLTMRLSAPSGRPVRVTWGLVPGTATLGSDVEPSTGVISFPLGTIFRTLTVSVHGDKIDEPNETFNLHLTSPLNVRLLTAYPRVILVDDDAPLRPTLFGFTPGAGTSQNVVLKGAAPSGTNVLVYRNATCAGAAELVTAAANLTSGIAFVVSPNAASSFSSRTRNVRLELSGCSNAVSYTHDTIAPSAPTSLTIVGGTPSNNNSPAATGTSEPGTLVQAYTDACQGSPVASGTASALGGAGISLGQVADNTSTTWWFDAVDAAGNRSGCSSPLTFEEDSVPPAMVGGLGLPSGVTGVGTQPVVVGTAEPGSVVSFYALAPGGSTCVATPVLTVSAADLLAGVRVPFVARATTARAVVVRDAAGNPSNPCGPASSISYTEASTEIEPNNTVGTANLGSTTVGV